MKRIITAAMIAAPTIANADPFAPINGAILDIQAETEAGFDAVDDGFDRVGRGFDRVRNELENVARGEAALAALSTLTFDPSHTGPQLALGVGASSRHGAVAGSAGLGIAISPDVFISARGAVTDRGDVVGGAGILIKW